jgi:diguanylate cyclase (GGDEF)-like protein
MLLPFAMTDTRDVVRAIAVRVIRSLEKPFYLAGETIQIGCSIGVALWPEEAAEIEEAIEQADQALYSAKRAGKGRVHFHLSHVADAQPSKVVG